MLKSIVVIVQIASALAFSSCRKKESKGKDPDSIHFVDVTIFGETYQMEDKPIWPLFGEYCSFGSVASYYDPERNVCDNSNLDYERYTDADGIPSARFKLSPDDKSKTIVIERTRADHWVTFNGEKLFCFGYTGGTWKDGIKSNVVPLFLTRRPASTVSDLTADEVVFIVSISPVSECSIYVRD